jgi:methyl-accepting chemotaxis protein
MKWFVNISTKSKLFFGFGVMILLIIIVSITAYTSIAGLHKTLVKLFEVEVPLSLEIVKSRTAMGMERMILARMIETDKKSDLDFLNRDLKENDKEIEVKINKFTELGGNNQNYMELINQLSAKRKEFINSRDAHTVPLIYAGKNNEARKYFFGTQFQHYEKMLDITANLSKLSEQADKILIQTSGQKVKEAFFVFVVIGIIGIVAGIVMVSYLTLIIANPLKQISGIAEQIAYGDLTVHVPSMQRTDEVGALVMSFGMMLESQKMMTKEITDVVDVLAENMASQTGTDTKNVNSMAQKLKGLIEQYKI